MIEVVSRLVVFLSSPISILVYFKGPFFLLIGTRLMNAPLLWWTVTTILEITSAFLLVQTPKKDGRLLLVFDIIMCILIVIVLYILLFYGRVSL